MVFGHFKDRHKRRTETSARCVTAKVEPKSKLQAYLIDIASKIAQGQHNRTSLANPSQFARRSGKNRCSVLGTLEDHRAAGEDALTGWEQEETCPLTVRVMGMSNIAKFQSQYYTPGQH